MSSSIQHIALREGILDLAYCADWNIQEDASKQLNREEYLQLFTRFLGMGPAGLPSVGTASDPQEGVT